MRHGFYRSCVVSECHNTSKKTPGKLWISVPSTNINKRITWLRLAGRDPESLSVKSPLFICEDHFNLENDMENYMQYKIMGSVKRVRMKPNCIPSKFNWQATKKKKSILNANRLRTTCIAIDEELRDEHYVLTSYSEDSNEAFSIRNSVGETSTSRIDDVRKRDASAISIDHDNPMKNYDLDNSDFQLCEDYTIEDVPLEPPQEFSWQKQEATVDLAEDECDEVAAERIHDDLSLYCSDEEDNKILGYVEDSNKHAGFHCNTCTKEILGFRYVCVQCLDFDLCSRCEAKGIHSQHYVLRIPGPRPYAEVQRVLSRVRKHLMHSMDPIKVADDDAVSIKSEVKEEDEELLHEEVVQQEEIEANEVENENDEISQDDEDDNQDDTDSIQDEADPLNTNDNSDTETMESGSEWAPSKEDLENIEEEEKLSDHEHEDLQSNTRNTRVKPSDIKPIIKIISSESNDTPNKLQPPPFQKKTPYIEIQPLNISTKTKPTISCKKSSPKITPQIPASKLNPQIVLNRLNIVVQRKSVTENIPTNKRTIVMSKSDFETFIKTQGPVKRTCVSGVSGNLVKDTGNRQLLTVNKVIASSSSTKDNDAISPLMCRDRRHPDKIQDWEICIPKTILEGSSDADQTR